MVETPSRIHLVAIFPSFRGHIAHLFHCAPVIQDNCQLGKNETLRFASPVRNWTEPVLCNRCRILHYEGILDEVEDCDLIRLL